MSETKNGEGDFVVNPEKEVSEALLGVAVEAFANLRLSDDLFKANNVDPYESPMRSFNIAPMHGKPEIITGNRVLMLIDRFYFNDLGPRRMTLFLQLQGEDPTEDSFRLYNLDFDTRMRLFEVRLADINPDDLDDVGMDIAEEMMRIKNSFGYEIEESGRVCDSAELEALEQLMKNLRPCLSPYEFDE